MDEVSIAHNASAVIRTCDAVGVLHLDIIAANPELVLFNKAITTRADKWVDSKIYASPSECLLPLKQKGFKVAATILTPDSIPYTELDYTQPLALVFGSESEGVSAEALSLADYSIMIPMVGMVQSLNLSVSVGIILYEALRQRQAKGFYGKMRLSPEELEAFMKKWLKIEEE